MKHKSDLGIGLRAAQCVRLFAHKHGLTIKTALSRLGYDRKTIYSWENDSAPGTHALQALAHFGFNVHYILTGHQRLPDIVP